MDDDKFLRYGKTQRGFGYAYWYDIYQSPCEIQESSLANPDIEHPGSNALWLGVEGQRMHLDRPQVKMLIGMLVEWLDSGRVQE